MEQKKEMLPSENLSLTLINTLRCFFVIFLVIDVLLIFSEEFQFWLISTLFPIMPSVTWNFISLFYDNYSFTCFYFFLGMFILSIFISVIPILKVFHTLIFIISLYFLGLVIQPIFFVYTEVLWGANIAIFILLMLCYLFFVLKKILKKDKDNRPKNIFVE